MRRVILLFLLGVAFTSLAEPDAVAKEEISHLISHLSASGCQFNRNGKWYDASRAVDHLKRKYEYLLKRDLVPNTEALIERAASESSVSGRPYLVKCGKDPEMRSAAWFREALENFRKESRNPEIFPFLESTIGSAFERDPTSGKFRAVEFAPDEDE